MSFVITLIGMCALFGSALYVFRRFDAMVYHIYVTDKARWQKMGSPIGYFWIPEGNTPFFRSTWSREALLVRFICAGMKAPNQSVETTRGVGR